MLPTFFLIGSLVFFIMTYILKNKNSNRTFYSFITGILLFLFAIMGFAKFKNYIVITIIIVAYYLANALFDAKHKKKQLEVKSKLQPKNNLSKKHK